jgi:hypothetical protein
MGTAMTNKNAARFKTYAKFWPYYLSQHKNRMTRILHFLGTFLALSAVIRAVVTFEFGWLVVALVIGYGIAWIAHAFIEKNHPATFEYPLWSLRGDFTMLGLWLAGRLDRELAKCGITT